MHPEKMVGLRLFDLLSPESAGLIQEKLATLSLNNPSETHEQKYVSLTGKTYWQEWTTTALFDQFGHILRLQSIGQDITERKLSEEGLRLQHELVFMLNSDIDLPQALENVLDTVLQFESIDCGGIYLMDLLNNNLTLAGQRGLSAQFVTMVSCYPADSPQVLLAKAGRTLYQTIANDSQLFGQFYSLENLRVMVSIPVLYHNQLIAVLNLASHTHEEIPFSVRSALETLAQELGVTLARLRMDAALRESEERFRTTVEQSFDGILIADQNFRIIEWNQAQTEIFGYSRAEMIGKYLWEYQFLIVSDEQKSPDLIVELKDRLLEDNSGKNDNWMYKSQEIEIRSKDGSRKRVHVSSFPIKLNDGRLYGAITHDSTEYRIVEQNHRMLFQEMLDAFAVHEILLDQQGHPYDYRFLSVNPAFERFTGLKAADIVGKTVLQVLPKTEPYWIETYGRVALTGEPIFFENLSSETGKYFEVKAFRPFPGQFACIFVDITERKRTEMSLKAAYTKLEALWGVASLAEADLKTTADHIIATLVHMTGSAFGFYGVMHPDESMMTILAWSGKAMRDRSVLEKPQTILIQEAGVWAEAVRNREPLILNHYSAERSAEKGFPDGHVPLTKLLVVPFFAYGKITSLVAVANRQGDYTLEDVNQVTAFLASVQTIVENKQAEMSLQESEARFKAVSEYSHNAICLIDEAGKIIWFNEAFLLMGAYSTDRVAEAKSFIEFLAPESVEFVTANFFRFVQKEAYQHHYSFYFVRSDGQKRLCEKHMTDYEGQIRKANLGHQYGRYYGTCSSRGCVTCQ